MAAREVTIRRQHAAITRVRDVIEKYNPEAMEQLRLLTPGGTVPNSAKSPDEVITYLAESIGVLADVVDELVEASKPRPRGRPRKAEKAEDRP